MTTLLLVRHGETDWNRERRYQGHADEPLNDAGRAQAEQLAVSLRDERFAAVYTSDLRRAAETAAIVATALRLPVEAEPRLREIDVGSWQGLTHDEIDGLQWDGESTDDHRARTVNALLGIAAAHPAERVLVVAHGGTVRRVQEAASGVALPVVENCGVWLVAVEDGEIRPID
jgi:broad specificity phosphatase PhoE